MKKFLYIVILLSILIVPNVYASNTVSIESISLDSKSETTQELEEPSFNGLHVNFKVKFGTVNDYVKYKIIVDNPTYVDYKITEYNNKTNKYLKYEYEYDDGNSIAEKKKKTTVYITLRYINEVPDSLLVDGNYIEKNSLELNLGDNNPPNPNTKRNIIISIIGILLVLVLYLISYKYQKKKNYMVILLALLLIPLSVKALEKLQVIVDYEIQIGRAYKVTYLVSEIVKESELDNYRLVDDWYDTRPCDQYYYMIENENGEYEKYLSCGIYKEDPKQYFPGDRVDIETSSNGSDEAFDAYCTEQETYAKCTKEYINSKREYNNLYYAKIYNINHNDNDIEYMNFESLNSNHWENSGYVNFNIPSRITMPKHNVYLIPDLPK